jgi:hypothetical protein
MRCTVSWLFAVTVCALAGAPVAEAHNPTPRAARATAAPAVLPRAAAAFQNSVGVTTHIVYYDTAYGDWPRIVNALGELGVKHIRDGVYANPAPQWHDWNERYYAAVGLATSHGIKFDFGMGQPNFGAGTIGQLVAVVRDRLRGAVDALEEPNELDLFSGVRNWPGPLAIYDRQLYRKVKADPSLRSLPVVGPSFAEADSPARLGNQQQWLDVGNIHPYTGGQSPGPFHTESELTRARITAGRKPVWATEAGFNNALHETDAGAQPAVSETAAAVYDLRTLLEHFKSGVARTYLYELIDEKPDPGLADSQQHYGLLRNDFSPKPAFTAIRNLLSLVGHGAPRAGLRPLRLNVTGDAGQIRRLVLQKADGTYVIALWRLTSAWSVTHRRAIGVRPASVTVHLPARSSAGIADPRVNASARRLRLHAGRARVWVGTDPVLLLVK